ncbi:MAG: hypothetical protein HQK54_17305, partial [Oligoflexales bacterium]|nr:hypothetical protein [Oligoflexales bacterium]
MRFSVLFSAFLVLFACSQQNKGGGKGDGQERSASASTEQELISDRSLLLANISIYMQISGEGKEVAGLVERKDIPAMVDRQSKDFLKYYDKDKNGSLSKNEFFTVADEMSTQAKGNFKIQKDIESAKN